MKNEPLPNQLRELAGGGNSPKPNKPNCARNRSAQADLEMESRLNAALARLPDAPVPSNFTARVLQAVEREEVRGAHAKLASGTGTSLVPRVAVAAAVIALCRSGFSAPRTRHQRAALAKNVALVAQAQPMPSVEALKNFDAIRRMSQPPHADDELLALLQ